MCGGWGRKAALCGLPRFLRPSGRSQRLREGALGREGHAALCGLPRFLRPSGRSQCLRGWGALGCEGHAAFLAAFGPLATLAPCGGLGRGGMPRFATCRVSCGLWAARNACGVGCAGAWDACRVLQHAAFLAAFGPLAMLAPCGVGCGGVGCMPRFAACRVSCGLWAARNACAVRGGVRGRGMHAAFCNLPRFLRPWAARNACVGGVRWGVRGMPRFATCRVSCGLRAARNACAYCAAAQVLGALPQTPAGG